jgi:hypothetical protein
MAVTKTGGVWHLWIRTGANLMTAHQVAQYVSVREAVHVQRKRGREHYEHGIAACRNGMVACGRSGMFGTSICDSSEGTLWENGSVYVCMNAFAHLHGWLCGLGAGERAHAPCQALFE